MIANTIKSEFEAIINYFLTAPHFHSLSLVLQQFTTFFNKTTITNKQVFYSAIKLLNYCLTSIPL